ncbi:MAG: guanylate kinase [Clostridia bacterium]|nr:guanylate kinase [Clostridia bacterium]
MNKRGILCVLSGPAGSGKGTVVQNVFKMSDDFAYSVSATTRAPRALEENGVHYHFITREKFQELIRDNKILEYTEYCGNYYGTLRSEVENKLANGKNVILEIEVEGAMNVRRAFPDAVLTMLLPPDYKTLEARLRNRGTNTEQDINNRMKRCLQELEYFDKYDYFIENASDVTQAAREFIAIVKSEQHRTKRNTDFPEIFKSNK